MTLSLIKILISILISLQVTVCKFEMDHLGIDLMYEAAIGADSAGAAPSFTATPGTDESWVDEYMPTENLLNSGESSFVMDNTELEYAEVV